MNVSNILKVADAIEQASVPGLGFNMAQYAADKFRKDDLSGHGCGTVACVAGWACVAAGQWTLERLVEQESDDDVEIFTAAKSILGLTEAEAWSLFLPDDFEEGDTLPEQAVRCLRNLAITGKVDWEAAMKGDEPALPPLPVSKSVVRA